MIARSPHMTPTRPFQSLDQVPNLNCHGIRIRSSSTGCPKSGPPLERPQRAVYEYSNGEFRGESQVTGVFTERDGKTTLTVTVSYPSKEVRDAVLQSGMEHGAAESYDKLAEMLATPAEVRT